MKIMAAQYPVTPSRPGFRPKLRYQKMGLGSLHLFDSIIKPNQIIFAYPEDIPIQYKDVLVCIDSPEMQDWAEREADVDLVTEALYKKVERETKGWYDVINISSEKAINEKGLRDVDAEALLISLNL
jgi:hypothetical protein